MIGVDAGSGDRQGLAEAAGRLREAGVEVRLDASGVDLAARARTLIKSPGVPQDAPAVSAARARGIAVLGELTARTSDLIVSFGERLSSVMVTAAFAERGMTSVHVDAREVILTDNHYGKAAPDEGKACRVSAPARRSSGACT